MVHCCLRHTQLYITGLNALHLPLINKLSCFFRYIFISLLKLKPSVGAITDLVLTQIDTILDTEKFCLILKKEQCNYPINYFKININI